MIAFVLLNGALLGWFIGVWLHMRRDRPRPPTAREQAHHAWLKRLHESRRLRAERGIQ